MLRRGRANGFHPGLHRRFQLKAAVGEHIGRPHEFKPETAELQMRNLVRGHYLEPGEVLRLVVVVVNHRRQIDFGAIRGRRVLVNPADLPAHQLLGAQNLNVLAGEGAGVETHNPLDPFQIQAGGQGFQHRFGGVGFDLEKGDAALRVFVEQRHALLIPLVQLGQRDAVQHRIQAFEEGRHRIGRRRQQAVAQVQDMPLRPGGNVREGLRAVVQEPGGIPQPHFRQLFAQAEETPGLPFLYVLQGAGRHFQARLDFPPAAVGERAGH